MVDRQQQKKLLMAKNKQTEAKSRDRKSWRLFVLCWLNLSSIRLWKH